MSVNDLLQLMFDDVLSKHYHPVASELYVRTFTKDSKQFKLEKKILASVLSCFRRKKADPNKNAIESWNFAIELTVTTYEYLIYEIIKRIESTKGILPGSTYDYFLLSHEEFKEKYRECQRYLGEAEQDWLTYGPTYKTHTSVIDLSDNHSLYAKLLTLKPPQISLFDNSIYTNKFIGFIESCISSIYRMYYYLAIKIKRNKLKITQSIKEENYEPIPHSILEKYAMALESAKDIEKKINLPAQALVPKTREHFPSITITNLLLGFAVGLLSLWIFH